MPRPFLGACEIVKADILPIGKESNKPGLSDPGQIIALASHVRVTSVGVSTHPARREIPSVELNLGQERVGSSHSAHLFSLKEPESQEFVRHCWDCGRLKRWVLPAPHHPHSGPGPLLPPHLALTSLKILSIQIILSLGSAVSLSASMHPGGNHSREEGKYTENCFLCSDGDPRSLCTRWADPPSLPGGRVCYYSWVRKLDFMPVVPKEKFHLFPSSFLQGKSSELEN